MKPYVISAKSSDGTRINLAECEKREYAEFIMAALKVYKSVPVQETAHIDARVGVFEPGTVELVWKADR